ncbi:MAG TPA: hypothetical protein VJH04_01450 [archaeon]|nr:hypothetical protein [archaeon]
MEIKKLFSTVDKLNELINNIHAMDVALEDKQKYVSIKNIEWVSPISILPLVIYAKSNGLKIECLTDDEDIESYLITICFPDGTEDLFDINTKYLPITKISCGLENSLLTDYEERILKTVDEKYRHSFISALKFLTSELQTNVEQHSRVGSYWILAQYWKKTETCEICMADTGIGYKESYKGTEHEVKDDTSAILNAIEGISSKTPEERGAGIPGILKIFIDGYKGELVMLSGNALLHLQDKKPTIYTCPISWKGCFIGIRFKLRDINIEKYY